MTPTIADLCADLPVMTFAPGEVLMAEGETSGRLYVLLDGAVEITKGGFQINLVSDRGAILGEMSVLLDLPHTATVRAVSACSAHVSLGGEAANTFRFTSKQFKTSAAGAWMALPNRCNARSPGLAAVFKCDATADGSLRTWTDR